MHPELEIQVAAQPISRFLRESGSQKKKRKKHAGQATRDWREAQGKTPATYPPRNNAHPPKIKIEHICQAEKVVKEEVEER